MDIYLQEDLDKFMGAAPFFTHPYHHWKSYESCVASLLGRMADDLQNVKGFRERLKQARNNVKEPLDFFSFTTELKVAHFLQTNNFEPEFIRAKSAHGETVASPDFKLKNGFFIEVHAPTKYFLELVRAEEELQKLDCRFRFKRRMGVPPSRQINWIEYWPKLEAEVRKWAGNELERNPQVLVGNWATENLVAELRDNSRLEYPDMHNAHGSPENTSMIYLNEAIRNKTECTDGKIRLKNGLANYRPNILWLEFLFLQEELQATNWNLFDFSEIKMPAELDSIVVSICGIDKGYQDSEKPMLLLNEEICSASGDGITQWFNSLGWHKNS
jgi:hypothetical protein